ncbi:uncharacterized protein LAJ45_11485 [Morchella importuna]|uniref:uncharacterized protein n=1 Tax=Morchella importuna TaxID=1174673 RepID=UPI001E8D1CA9|nr:uncharacterized protein LAJ45_11485 [Morchella importuna]KAH8144510.1 hypothetical protein LAJ45_11485 [Morchella importuna]
MELYKRLEREHSMKSGLGVEVCGWGIVRGAKRRENMACPLGSEGGVRKYLINCSKLNLERKYAGIQDEYWRFYFVFLIEQHDGIMS